MSLMKGMFEICGGGGWKKKSMWGFVFVEDIKC